MRKKIKYKIERWLETESRVITKNEIGYAGRN
jgi:hypothetical protein